MVKPAGAARLLPPAAVIIGLAGGVVAGLVLWAGLVGVAPKAVVQLKKTQ